MPKFEKPVHETAPDQAPFPVPEYPFDARRNGKILKGEEIEELFPPEWELDETASKYLGKIIRLREQLIDNPEQYGGALELLILQQARSEGKLRGLALKGEVLIVPELNISIGRSHA